MKNLSGGLANAVGVWRKCARIMPYDMGTMIRRDVADSGNSVPYSPSQECRMGITWDDMLCLAWIWCVGISGWGFGFANSIGWYDVTHYPPYRPRFSLATFTLQTVSDTFAQCCRSPFTEILTFIVLYFSSLTLSSAGSVCNMLCVTKTCPFTIGSFSKAKSIEGVLCSASS